MAQQLAIYMRLSQEDMNVRNNQLSDESNSIRNQRLLIEKYISEQEDLKEIPVAAYTDDGFSGTNFCRPGVQTLLAKVKSGEICCIVVKDLSRFGRNYLEVGDYLEHIFPLLGVRFISINDHYDSDRYVGSTGGIDVAFRNLVYQRYAQDLSEKIKSSRHMQMKKGKFVSHCPYGYMRHPVQKHQMVIDPETAPIVREIFQEAINGKHSSEIAAMLNERNLPTPMTYKNWENPNVRNRVMWSHQAVLRILQNYKYTGAMVSFKCGNETIRARSQKRYKPEDWVITKGCHEPIISEQTFQEANNRIRKPKSASRRKTDCKDRLYFCGCCGRRLRKTHGLEEYFSCQTPLYQKDADCREIFWSRSELESILIRSYRLQLQLMEKDLQERAVSSSPDPVAECRKAQARISSELRSIDSEKLRLYESYREGNLSREALLAQKGEQAQKQATLQEQLKKLQKEEEALLAQAASAESYAQQQKQMIRQIILSDTEIRPYLYDAVERVDVFPSRELVITWRFSDIQETVN